MNVMMEAGYHIGTAGKYTSVPSPADGNPDTPWFWDYLASQSNSLAHAGITDVLIPPPYKAEGGAGRGCDGYGTYDGYDLGSKPQQNSTPTRFGSREQLQRMIAIMRANGIGVHLDLICHQRMGGRNGVYRFLAFDGSLNGRFPLDPGCFLGNPKDGRVPRDPIAGPVEDDYSFGDELCPVNAVPKHYVWNGLVDWASWLAATLGIQGFRIDDTKGENIGFVKALLDSEYTKGLFAVGEYYDGNPNALQWWVNDSGMGGRSSTFDFALRWPLQRMCNNSSRWDMRQLARGGFNAINPFKAVTFLENHDTDLSFPCIWNKALGYAALLTMEGLPCVFARDYFVRKDCYGLKPLIDNLIWIRSQFANGSTAVRNADYQTFVYERLGQPGLLVGLHNDMYNGWATVDVQTNFGSGVRLHDYTGHGGDIWTDWRGHASLPVPPNDNGHGYVCYSVADINKAIAIQKLPTVQVFEGAPDLDLGPALPKQNNLVGRIWCEKGTIIHLESNIQGLSPTVFEQDEEIPVQHGQCTTKRRGWHALGVDSTLRQTVPYKLKVTYMGTQTL